MPALLQERSIATSIACTGASHSIYPFESIFSDFFDSSDFHYLIAGDRLSGWVEVFSSPVKTKNSGSHSLVSHLRSFFGCFGVPNELSSDGGPEFTAKFTSDFLKRWNVHHRISSAYYPKSNGRAEVAVKKEKRFLISCIGPSGSLDNDKFLRGMLQIRNTPDPDCKLSPAQIVFGRPLRDAFSFVNRTSIFKNPAINSIWKQAWSAKEDAIRTRFVRSVESSVGGRELPTLVPGERVFIQNQTGPHLTKWDRSGIVMECRDFNQYLVKVDGTGRITLRNRKFLKKYTMPSPIQHPSCKYIEPVLKSPSLTAKNTEGSFASTLTAAGLNKVISPSPVTKTPDDSSASSDDVPMPERNVTLDTIVDAVRPARSKRPPKQYVPETGTWEV